MCCLFQSFLRLQRWDKENSFAFEEMFDFNFDTDLRVMKSGAEKILFQILTFIAKSPVPILSIVCKNSKAILVFQPVYTVFLSVYFWTSILDMYGWVYIC